MSTPVVVALVGNPNIGKTTLFNRLTGKQQEVGNWCGVTVEQKRGCFKQADQLIEVVDLPGCYNCFSTVESAIDERITHDYLSAEEANLIVNVVDATNLERHLYLTLQLLERKLPVIVAVNMMDSAKKQGITINIETLAKHLGCPVIPLVAINGQGLQDLKTAIRQYSTESQKPLPWVFSAGTEPGSDMAAAKARFDIIHHIINASVIKATVVEKPNGTARIDAIVLNRILGIPLFLALMYVVFTCAIQVSGVFQEYFELAANTIFIDGVQSGLINLHAPDWLIRVMAFGVGQGIKTTLSFIPVITAMFFAISFLEASGYMARAAFVMDRVMQWVGLPGKSFVPMIIGFGCNVPAVMATRTLENYRERILTILMSPFMSCGARLAIYALFVSAFFPNGGQNVIFGLYLIGIAVALLTGFVLRTTVLQGGRSNLIIELPSYRWPRIGTLWQVTWRRLKHFILNAGSLIVPLCAVIALLGVVQDKPGSNQWLASAGKTLTPIFAPMGIKEDNWPATVGLMTGVLAKEVVVGTLNALYTEENVSSQGVMVDRFGSKAAAFSYLLFVLLYFPCVSVVATIARELNRSWALFSVAWTTGIAYITAVLFYQCAILPENPWTSLLWVTGMCSVLVVAFYGVRKRMNQKINARPKPLPTQIIISNT